MGATLRAASPADLHPVLGLLRAAGLPAAGVEAFFPEGFVVARTGDGEVVGAVGVERYGQCGLLRSLVVREDQRGTGLGQRLGREAVQRAREGGVRDLYLLTTTAERFFPRLGFRLVRREDFPAALHASAELRGACPASAVAMHVAPGSSP